MITLNEIEIRLVQHLAKMRYAYCREHGATATLYGNIDKSEKAEAIKREMDYVGAELAFCKLHNIYPDLTHDTFRSSDCTLSNGETVDVKQAPGDNHRLLCKVEATKDHIRQGKELPDWYALMVGIMPKYKFVGFMAASDLLQDSRINYSFPVPAYTATQHELRLVIQLAER